MYLSKKDAETIWKALNILSPEEFRDRPEEQQLLIIQAELVIFKDVKARRERNKKTLEYINNKRKDNYLYGRSKEEITKHKEALEKRVRKELEK